MKLSEMVDTRTRIYQWLTKYDNSLDRPSKEDLKIEGRILTVDNLWLRPVPNSIDKRFSAPQDILVDANGINIAGFDVSSIALNWVLHTRTLTLAGEGDWTKSMPGIIANVGSILHIQTSADSKINLLDLFKFKPGVYISVSVYPKGYGQLGSEAKLYVNSNQHGGFVVTFDDDLGAFDEEANDEFELQDILIRNSYERFV